MRKRSLWEVIKSAAKNFSTGMGAASIIFSVVSVFVGIGLIISIPVSAAIGILFGAAGAYFTYKEIEKKRQKEAARHHHHHEAQSYGIKILSITKGLEHDLKDLKQDIIKQNENIKSMERQHLTTDKHLLSKSSSAIFKAPSQPKNDSIYGVETEKLTEELKI